MKEMSKAKIIDKKSEKSVKSERDLLSKLSHPFIVNMHYSFQDNDHLYLVMDLLTGGDLRYHLCKKKCFTEDQTKFFLSCIILGLEYIHSNNIIHRDIKPENLILDYEGYVHITDFGIAKISQPNNFRETSGTPGYMSPEVLCSMDHTISVDYYALGIMGYEFMKGVRPYLGRNRKEIKEKVMAKQILIRKNDIKEGWSLKSADFINKLMQRKPSHRLGANGPVEVKKHIWFEFYPWKDLYNKKLKAPFIPPNEDNFDYRYCNNAENQGKQTLERYEQILGSDNYKEAFNDYKYFNRYENDNNNSEFTNPHEKMYAVKKIHYKKIRHKRILNDENEDLKKEYSSYCNAFVVNHNRASSAIDIEFKKAFLEANNYINNRKYIKKKNISPNSSKIDVNKSSQNIAGSRNRNTLKFNMSSSGLKAVEKGKNKKKLDEL